MARIKTSFRIKMGYFKFVSRDIRWNAMSCSWMKWYMFLFRQDYWATTKPVQERKTAERTYFEGIVSVLLVEKVDLFVELPHIENAVYRLECFAIFHNHVSA